jgi:hypothetical protein
MFEADWAWVGVLLGAAAAALRTYLKGTEMTIDEQRQADIAVVRDEMWRAREGVVADLLGECAWHMQWAEACLRLIGWNPSAFIAAALLDSRDVLDA